MEIELPATGCNILNNNGVLYNYPNARTRNTYVIYDGKLFLSSQSTSNYDYSYNGTCLVTGDLIYKPEIPIYFQFISLLLVAGCFLLIFNIMFKRFLK